MKQIVLTEKEARTVLQVLKTNWVSIDIQPIILEIVKRIERELET